MLQSLDVSLSLSLNRTHSTPVRQPEPPQAPLLRRKTVPLNHLLRHLVSFSVQPLCSLWLSGSCTQQKITTEPQRTQRLHREEASLNEQRLAYANYDLAGSAIGAASVGRQHVVE